MANVDRPNGLRAVDHLLGVNSTGKAHKYYSDTDDLFMGDVVFKNAGGVVAGNGGDGGYAAVLRVTNPGDGGGDEIPLGVVVGWEADPANLERLFHASSVKYAVYINDDPYTIYECQVNDGGLAIGATGLNVDLVVAAGTEATGLSNMEVDGGTEVATASTPWKIMGLAAIPGNDVTSANSKWLIMANMHQYKNDSGTAGK